MFPIIRHRLIHFAVLQVKAVRHPSSTAEITGRRLTVKIADADSCIRPIQCKVIQPRSVCPARVHLGYTLRQPFVGEERVIIRIVGKKSKIPFAETLRYNLGVQERCRVVEWSPILHLANTNPFYFSQGLSNASLK